MEFYSELENIYKIAKSANGKSFRQIMLESGLENEDIQDANKGGLGNLVQKHLFGIKPNSRPEPDFDTLDVELKVVPLKYTVLSKNNEQGLTIKERLVANMINFHEIVHESFDRSSFITKNNKILLMFYIHDYDIENKLDFTIYDSILLTISKQPEFKNIKNDWNSIVESIKTGKAHELSEGKTEFLGACPKGKNSNDLVAQPFSEEFAMKRAFTLKISFLKNVLNRYSKKHDFFTETILETKQNQEYFWEESTIKKELNKFIGTQVTPDSKAKNWIEIKLKKIIKNENPKLYTNLYENEQYSVLHKVAINNKPQEELGTNVMLEPLDIINEEFENSSLYNDVILKRFVVLLVDKDSHKFIESKFFSIDLDYQIENCKKVFYKVKNEIQKLLDNNNQNEVISFQGAKISDNLTIHIRPKAKNKKVTYKVKGKKINMVLVCWWINKKEFF